MIVNQIQREVRFATIEERNRWVVYAILIEREGDEVRVSEPRIVKIIAKNVLALEGSVGSFALGAPVVSTHAHQQSIPSPYASSLLYADNGILTWLGARPPTYTK